MAKKLYVGNLSYSTTEESLGQYFARFGEVVSAAVIKDRATGQSKGFGFVELSDEAAADKAIEELNGKEFEGRRIRVNVAEERPRRPRPEGGFRPRRSFDGEDN